MVLCFHAEWLAYYVIPLVVVVVVVVVVVANIPDFLILLFQGNLCHFQGPFVMIIATDETTGVRKPRAGNLGNTF